MTGTELDRGRTAARLLLEVAGPRLYQRNPFRVTALPTAATAREVRQRRTLALDAFDLGVAAGPADPRLPLPEPPTEQDVRTAFDTLASPDRRLVHELFWWWGEPGECGCPAAVHDAHDRAVEAHARALDATLAGSPTSGVSVRDRFDRWTGASEAWTEALAADGFWEHVRHRMRAQADRRLDEATIAGLREAMPRALLNPQATLARNATEHAGLASLLDLWDVPVEVIDDARAYAAGPAYERTEELLKEFRALLDNEDGETAARRARTELPTAAALLETLVPHERHRRSARLRNQIAVLMNNSALELPHSTANTPRRVELLRAALDLAVMPEDRKTISGNLADDEKVAAAGSPAARDEWQVVENYRAMGNYALARGLLKRMRRQTTDPRVLARIEEALAEIGTRSWPAFLTLVMGYYLLLMYVLVPVWKSPSVVIATMALTLVPVMIGSSRGFRELAGRHQRAWMVALVVATCLSAWTLLARGMFGLIFVAVSGGALRITVPLGSWLAKQMDAQGRRPR